MNQQFGIGMNIGFGMPNMMPMPGMNNQFMNMNADEGWMKGFKIGVEEINSSGTQDDDANKPEPKLYVIFQKPGATLTLPYAYGTTIEKALEKYLRRLGRPELIGYNSNKIRFFSNVTQLKFGDKTKVEVFFKNVNNPIVAVYESDDILIGH